MILIFIFCSRYAPPALDVLIFLYFNTSKELKKENFQKLLDYYYNCLKKNLRLKNLDIKTIFPKFEFKNSIESMKIKAMTAVIAYMSIDFLETNKTKKGAVSYTEVWNCLSVNTSKLVLKQFKEVEVYKKRLFNNMEEIYDYVEKHHL